MLAGARRRLTLSLSVIYVGMVWAQPISATPPGASDVHAEIARGASAIAAINPKKFPYATAYRLMRARLEENVQAHRDSDGFVVGAHLVIAAWLAALPNDVGWRQKALARHCDVVGWVLPRLGLPANDVESTTARAAKLTPAQRQQLTEILRDLTSEKPTRSVH